MLAQVEGGPKSRDLGEGEKLNQSLVNKHFVPLDQWRPHFSQSLMKQRMGIWKVCVWPLGKQGGHRESKSNGEGWFFAVRPFQEHKSGGGFLTHCYFPGAQG